jgi:hypothetical protein
MLPDAAPPAGPEQAGPPKGGPPGAPPPGGPPAGGPPVATPPAGAPGAPPAAGQDKGKDKAKDGKDADKGDKGEKKSSEDIIQNFMKSDPRDILREKTTSLKEKETKPWNESNPDTFIPETGRTDPLTPVISALPPELLPKRGDEETNDLVTYQMTTDATLLMEGIVLQTRCYSVIQVGVSKRVRMSFDGGKSFQILSEDSQFPPIDILAPDGTPFQMNVGVGSISADQVVINVSVSVPNTSVSVQKSMVFIPRNFQ